MELEWRTTDKNTVFGECDYCHLERPLKEMKIPGIEEYLSDDDEFEYLTDLYCLSCYKQAKAEAESW